MISTRSAQNLTLKRLQFIFDIFRKLLVQFFLLLTFLDLTISLNSKENVDGPDYCKKQPNPALMF